MKNSFLMYLEYEEYFDMLCAKEQAKLIKAMFLWQKGESTKQLESTMDKQTMMCWAFIRNQLAKDEDKYIAKCEKNRVNGSRGGRPKQIEQEEEKANGFSENPKKRTVILETQKSERFFQKPKKPDNDNERDNDNENEYENDNERIAPSEIFSLSQKFVSKYPSKDATLPANLKLPNNFDVDKLLIKVSESDFLSTCNNLGLAWCIEHYSDIVADKYRNYHPTQQQNPDALKKRKYSQEEIESVFDNFNEIDL